MYTSNGELINEGQNHTVDHIVDNLPEHVDDPFLNRHVLKGILGFQYKNKDTQIIVYSSIENKTFCMIMQLKVNIIYFRIIYFFCN